MQLWLNAVAILISVACVSSNGIGHCLLQAKKGLALHARAGQPIPQAHKDPKCVLDTNVSSSTNSLQAPIGGGSFSLFFNNVSQGPGVWKWLQYFPAYERHLSRFIGKEVHILEIGVQSGGSLIMWKSVFGSSAYVYGCDINPNCKAYEDSRTRVFIGDQESPEFWERVLNAVPQIDILIDDGGHTEEQQIATLGIMLPRISPGGVYITEDIHESDNPFWQSLKFAHLQSPAGKHYKGLHGLVASVHIYPYLLVIERSGSTSGELVKQLASAPSGQPAEFRTAVVGGPAQSVGSRTQLSLQRVFPWLHWNGEKNSTGKDLFQLSVGIQPKGWLIARDGSSEFSFEDPWDLQADAFMSDGISNFLPMHEGSCPNWNANYMQQKIESLHFYPHLLIARRTDSDDQLVKAPRHGTKWIPLH